MLSSVGLVCVFHVGAMPSVGPTEAEGKDDQQDPPGSGWCYGGGRLVPTRGRAVMEGEPWGRDAAMGWIACETRVHGGQTTRSV